MLGVFQPVSGIPLGLLYLHTRMICNFGFSTRGTITTLKDLVYYLLSVLF